MSYGTDKQSLNLVVLGVNRISMEWTIMAWSFRLNLIFFEEIESRCRDGSNSVWMLLL